MTDSRLPTRKRDWQQLISNLGLRPSKGRGQNFLHDLSIVHRIVKEANIGSEDHVLEIGPGLGMLTQELLRQTRKVSAIELDVVLASHLERTFGNRPDFHLLRADALRTDLSEIAGTVPIKVVANLPYSAAAAIIQHVLESEIRLVSATVMVQREVAERMLASPPGMSILAVATQVYATGRIAFIVPPDVFLPSPTIDSAVITLVPHERPLITPAQRSPFFRIVNAGFRHKRKNIANSLADETQRAKAEITQVLESIGIDPSRRAQTLTVSEWLSLNDAWFLAEATRK
jgi:16S rRNA (adenine1518-N6/adenine1519-N6)-dimethyltransferase